MLLSYMQLSSSYNIHPYASWLAYVYHTTPVLEETLFHWSILVQYSTVQLVSKGNIDQM